MKGFKLEKRDPVTGFKRALNPIVFVILAMLFSSIFMVALSYNPIEVYVKMIQGAFGSWKGLSESIVYAIPLMLCGLGVSISFKMSLNNIGAEGQFAMGAMAAAGVALFIPGIPGPLMIPLMVLAGFLAGAVWGAIAVIPKAFWGVNETIITLMMNYIALYFVDYLVYGPWRDTSGVNLPLSPVIPDEAKMSVLFGTRINTGVIIAIIVAVLIFLFFKYTTLGYQITVIGRSVKSAKYAGMNIVKNILIVMFISGGLAGLAGVTQVSGMVYRLQSNIANNAGFTAIIISYLSKFNPIIVLFVSVFFGGLTMGGYSVQVMGVPSQVVTMIQGSILVFVLGGEILTRYRIILPKKKKSEKAGEVA